MRKQYTRIVSGELEINLDSDFLQLKCSRLGTRLVSVRTYNIISMVRAIANYARPKLGACARTRPGVGLGALICCLLSTTVEKADPVIV